MAPAPTRPAAATTLGEVVWARVIDSSTSAPAERQETIPRTQKHVYAVVETGPLAAGTTLTATWTFNGRPIDGTEVVLTTDVARQAGWVEFHLDWKVAGLWPTGVLAVEITASSGESARGTVEIEGT